MDAEFRLKRILVTRAIQIYRYQFPCVVHFRENVPSVNIIIACFGASQRPSKTGVMLRTEVERTTPDNDLLRHFYPTAFRYNGRKLYIQKVLKTRIRLSLNSGYVHTFFEIPLFFVLHFFHENFHFFDQIRARN